MSKNKFFFNLIILFCFVAAALILVGAVLWEWKYPLPYQLSALAVQPASTPASLGELTTRVENLENDQK